MNQDMKVFSTEDFEIYIDAEAIDANTPPHLYQHGPLTLIHDCNGVSASLKGEEGSGWWIEDNDRAYLWEMCGAIIAGTKGKSKKQMRDYFNIELGL